MRKNTYETPQIFEIRQATYNILAGSTTTVNVDTGGDGPPISDGGGGDPGNFANTAVWYEEETDTLPTLKFNLWQ